MHFTQLVLLAAVGVSAHPSGHAHLRFHEKKDIEARDGQVVTATIEGKVVYWTVGAGAPFVHAHKPTHKPAPAPTPAAAPTPAPAAPTPASQPAIDTGASNVAAGAAVGQGLSEFQDFGSCGAQKRSLKRASAASIWYKGNTGCTGYGTNMKLVKSNIAGKYKYTVKVVGGGAPMKCVGWNKIGPDGGINGFFTGNQALSFDLPANGVQYIAYDENTQAGLSCHEGEMPLTSFGQFAGPWLETDFGSAVNGKWNGFDSSNLVAGKYGIPMKGLKACGNGVCSVLLNGGGGSNSYQPGMEDVDGVGANLPPGPVSITADFS